MASNEMAFIGLVTKDPFIFVVELLGDLLSPLGSGGC